jgi:hypothetical protein
MRGYPADIDRRAGGNRSDDLVSEDDLTLIARHRFPRQPQQRVVTPAEDRRGLGQHAGREPGRPSQARIRVHGLGDRHHGPGAVTVPELAAPVIPRRVGTSAGTAADCWWPTTGTA